MIIIYHCYGGNHSSVVAASIHVGILPDNRVPHYKDFFNLNLFDSDKKVLPGKLHYFGRDEFNNQIYSCGMRNNADIIIRTSKELMNISGINKKSVKFINTLKCVNYLMRIGGCLSQKINIKSVGKPIVTAGTVKAYPQIVKLVKTVQKNISTNNREGV